MHDDNNNNDDVDNDNSIDIKGGNRRVNDGNDLMILTKIIE